MISVKLVDILCLIFAFILIILVNVNPLPENLEYIPAAIQGLTTLTGILIGFIGLCMTYLYSSFGNVEIRKRLRSRFRYVALVIVFALLIVGSAYGDLVYGRLFSAYKTILVGSVLVDILFLNTLFVLFSLVEEEQ